MSVDRDQDEALAWEALKEDLLKPPTIIGARAMLAAADLDPLFLVREAIPAGAITLFVGIPGAKKSWLAYALALETARAGEWLGRAVTPCGVTHNVLVLNYDNSTAECGRRFKRLGMRPDDPIFFHSVEVGALRLPTKRHELRAIAAALKPSLIIGDSFRQSQEADENSSKEMAEVMSCYKDLTANGCAVVVIHHASKSDLATGLGKARGSGEIPASADAVVIVSKEEEHDVATWDKHRCWEMADTEASVPFELVDDGDETRLAVLT